MQIYYHGWYREQRQVSEDHSIDPLFWPFFARSCGKRIWWNGGNSGHQRHKVKTNNRSSFSLFSRSKNREHANIFSMVSLRGRKGNVFWDIDTWCPLARWVKMMEITSRPMQQARERMWFLLETRNRSRGKGNVSSRHSRGEEIRKAMPWACCRRFSSSCIRSSLLCRNNVKRVFR